MKKLLTMRRYIVTLLFAMIVIGFYHFVEINLFSFDFLKRTKNALFDLRDIPSSDEETLLFNISSLQLEELQGKIDSLLTGQPKKIGVSLCHYDKFPQHLVNRFKNDNRVVFVNCKDSGPGSLSRIVEDSNIVTHFRTDKQDYFELLLTNFKGRGHGVERINYGQNPDFVFKRELSTSYHWFDSDFLEGKTVLLGYMGDCLTDSIYYYKDCRITPLNKYYGQGNMLPDMYDIEISANILRTIKRNEFINEVNPIVRIFFIPRFQPVQRVDADVY